MDTKRCIFHRLHSFLGFDLNIRGWKTSSSSSGKSHPLCWMGAPVCVPLQPQAPLQFCREHQDSQPEKQPLSLCSPQWPAAQVKPCLKSNFPWRNYSKLSSLLTSFKHWWQMRNWWAGLSCQVLEAGPWRSLPCTHIIAPHISWSFAKNSSVEPILHAPWHILTPLALPSRDFLGQRGSPSPRISQWRWMVSNVCSYEPECSCMSRGKRPVPCTVPLPSHLD